MQFNSRPMASLFAWARPIALQWAVATTGCLLAPSASAQPLDRLEIDEGALTRLAQAMSIEESRTDPFKTSGPCPSNPGQQCPREETVTWSWRVRQVAAEIQGSTLTFSGLVETETPEGTNQMPFDVPVAVTVDSRAFVFQGQGGEVFLEGPLFGSLTFLRRVVLADHFTLRLPHRGTVQNGPTSVALGVQQPNVQIAGDRVVLTGRVR